MNLICFFVEYWTADLYFVLISHNDILAVSQVKWWQADISSRTDFKVISYTVNPLLSPLEGLFILNTFNGAGEGGLFNLAQFSIKK